MKSNYPFKKSKAQTVFLTLILIFVFSNLLYSQNNSDLFRINNKGRLLWKDSGQEAFFWGVNYTTPFAHAFRQIAREGENRKEVIDHDVYHLSRLGINAFRIHVWDCEISDSLGNLLHNEHLDLFDYLVYKLQQRGVYSFLTPIAYWGNGYPEQNADLPGFSGDYSKGNVYTEPAAIAAQENYLKQFVNHVNPYTGKAYKNDPMVVAFEVCNEPGHSKAKETTEFVKKMKAAIRTSGCKKPVFYNVTQSINLLEDFIKGGTDGVTFQWYPSGLVANQERVGNFLPHVDKYDMPFENESYFQGQARFVYEFDAADIGRSYMYPPIALSFKEAGMQWVSMFAYDPVALASINTEYQTHFLNLAYAPQKAIGFKIASELFRNPSFKRNRETEKFPFEMKGVKISYTEDLSELATDELFYYTNNTTTSPSNPSALKSVAGFGSSPQIKYNGLGAYFLDKIEDGVWRLEVMPDAYWVRDPFSRATPRIENVVIKWEENDMSINLPGLNNNFQVVAVNNGNSKEYKAVGKDITVSPGVYILSNNTVDKKIGNKQLGEIKINEFYAPNESVNKSYVIHKAPSVVAEGQPVEVKLIVVSSTSGNKKYTVHPAVRFRGYRGPRGFRRPPVIEMKKENSSTYSAIIPDSLVTVGTLNYTIQEESMDGQVTVYPGAVKGPIRSWEYYNPGSYSINVKSAKAEMELFYAGDFRSALTFQGDYSINAMLTQTGITGQDKLRFKKGESRRMAWQTDNPEIIYGIEKYVGDIFAGVSSNGDHSMITINGQSTNKPVKVRLSLISKNGETYSAETFINSKKDQAKLNLKDFKPGKMLLLPRPFPGFLPLWYEYQNQGKINLDKIERLQIIIPREGNEEISDFEINSLILK